MTRDHRERLATSYYHALLRAERAGWYGDRAGQLIARGDARRILAAMTRADDGRTTASAER